MQEISIRRGYADGPFGQVHYREAKPGMDLSERAAVVCFHQSPMSGMQYQPFQDELAKDRLVLCPDTPGFGGSDTPPGPVTILDYANAMAQALESLGYGPAGSGPVDVFGGHTGSVIGTELAVSRPDLVRSIVYPSVALFTDAQKKMMLERFGGPPGYFTDADFVANAYKQTVLEGHQDIAPERRLALFAERMRSGMKASYAPDAVMSYDAEAQLQKLTQPALILVLDDMLAENSRRAGSLIPNVQVREMEHIPHGTAWDAHAAEIAIAVRQFFDAL